MRLDKLHWLETRWEETKIPGRPPRHLYRLSGTAREWAREEIRTAGEQRFWKTAEHEA
jgi:DNA-binding PadR family transcriptional regulator